MKKQDYPNQKATHEGGLPPSIEAVKKAREADFVGLKTNFFSSFTYVKGDFLDACRSMVYRKEHLRAHP
jgi:hypothetical protein